MSDFINFLMDPNERSKMRNAFFDAANRGIVAGTLGAPADMATTLSNLLIAGGGYAAHKAGLIKSPPDLIDPKDVRFSSEWIGQKMQDAGAVGSGRNALAEAGMGLLSPAAFMGANKLGAVLHAAEARAVANAAAPSTMAMRGQRGVLKVASDGEALERKFPGAQQFIKDVEKLSEDHGTIYARWSASDAHDMSPGAKSRDYVSGGVHSGLSAVPIDGTTHPVDIAKRLAEYNFARMNDPRVTLRLYTGNRLGTDSDGYASISPIAKVIDVPNDFINHIDSGFVKAYELADKIAEAREKASNTTGAAKQLWSDALYKHIAEFKKLME